MNSLGWFCCCTILAGNMAAVVHWYRSDMCWQPHIVWPDGSMRKKAYCKHLWAWFVVCGCCFGNEDIHIRFVCLSEMQFALVNITLKHLRIASSMEWIRNVLTHRSIFPSKKLSYTMITSRIHEKIAMTLRWCVWDAISKYRDLFSQFVCLGAHWLVDSMMGTI